MEGGSRYVSVSDEGSDVSNSSNELTYRQLLMILHIWRALEFASPRDFCITWDPQTPLSWRRVIWNELARLQELGYIAVTKDARRSHSSRPSTSTPAVLSSYTENFYQRFLDCTGRSVDYELYLTLEEDHWVEIETVYDHWQSAGAPLPVTSLWSPAIRALSLRTADLSDALSVEFTPPESSDLARSRLDDYRTCRTLYLEEEFVPADTTTLLMSALLADPADRTAESTLRALSPQDQKWRRRWLGALHSCDIPRIFNMNLPI
jgi:hypothetical protein